MNRIPVSSSNVAEVGYDPITMVLEVAFQNGGVYQYFDVPETVYSELMRAPSIGKFLCTEVENSYRYSKL
ncbi:MAG: KTSC domain-containing protein [Spirochaetia bacterium]|jgi:hypothetical protein